MKNKKWLSHILVGAFALLTLPACAATQTQVSGYPESVAEDDDVFYVTCIGKTMTPTEKDGDGFIVTMDSDGDIISANAFPNVKLDAPKGTAIEDDVLYVADIDRVVGIDLKTGMVVQVIDLSKEGMKFLNDLVEDDDFLYASATDINKIFKINLKTGAYEEIVTAEPLNAPNGLDIEDNILYVAEYATDAGGKPAGKIKAIPLRGKAPLPVTVVYEVPGQYDGIAVYEEEDMFGNETMWLLFSDWAMNGKSGAVKKMNMKTREVKNATTVPVNGPADFIIEEDEIWLPAMADQKVVID